MNGSRGRRRKVQIETENLAQRADLEKGTLIISHRELSGTAGPNEQMTKCDRWWNCPLYVHIGKVTTCDMEATSTTRRLWCSSKYQYH
jgi:hypothetical protein